MLDSDLDTRPCDTSESDSSEVKPKSSRWRTRKSCLHQTLLA